MGGWEAFTVRQGGRPGARRRRAGGFLVRRSARGGRLDPLGVVLKLCSGYTNLGNLHFLKLWGLYCLVLLIKNIRTLQVRASLSLLVCNA